MQQLDGPRIEPRGRTPAALVVLLHGYGANGDDLIGLADGWQARLPEAVFVAPNAPQSIPGMYGGLQWFALTLRDPSEYWRGVVSAQPALDHFITEELRRYRLPGDRLVLVGFSQGTMMALHVGLRRTEQPTGIVGYSGLLAGPEHLARDQGTPADPAHSRRGRRPDPRRRAAHGARASGQSDVPVEWHIRPGLGHGIDQAAQWMGAHFIAAAVKDRQRA